MRAGRLGAVAVLALLVSTQAASASLADWGAIVVAGDWHAHSGAPSEVFDNARHDIGKTLEQIGIQPSNLEEFSIRPERYPADAPRRADPGAIGTGLWDLSNRTTGGCLVYFTSHGSPDGVVLGDNIYAPDRMAQIINNACGDRPTVAIISACYSGIFVPALQGPNRLVLTAARPDRTSFGCGESDKYTFFDACMMQSLKPSGDFVTLAHNVQACVAAREKKEQVDYPSEPQLFVGSDVVKNLPKWK